MKHQTNKQTKDNQMNKRTLAILIATIAMILSSLACDDGGIIDNSCSTCGSPTSGGQIMNPDSIVQQGWDWLDQFDTTK